MGMCSYLYCSPFFLPLPEWLPATGAGPLQACKLRLIFPAEPLALQPGFPFPAAEALDNPSSNRRVLSAISAIAASNTSLFTLDGARYPDTFRTYCKAARTISSSEGGALEFLRIFILRHMFPLYQ
jgi:hypothetical protein